MKLLTEVCGWFRQMARPAHDRISGGVTIAREIQVVVAKLAEEKSTRQRRWHESLPDKRAAVATESRDHVDRILERLPEIGRAHV